MTKVSIVLLGTLLLMSFTAITPYKIGDAVSDFSLKSVYGKMVAMADYKAAKGFIIIFTCNHCPFAKRYQERMNLLNKKYGPKGFPLLAISSNDASVVPEDTYENMIIRAKEQKYNFPYLYDATQSVARAFGAVKTPQAYVVFKENGVWRLKYSGAIDDNGAEPEKVKNRYLEDAVEALLNNRPVTVAMTKSVGCGIKWKQ